MKITHTIISIIALSLTLVSCKDQKEKQQLGDEPNDYSPKNGTGVPHDHDGDGVPDHGPGEHGKKAGTNTGVPHDHDGDGVPDHGPGAHGHTKK